MGESSSSDASLSFSASSSSEEEDNRRTRRHRHHHRGSKPRNRKRSRTSSNNNNYNGNEASILLPPAPSDWDQLRSHFQFVLPDDDNEHNNEHTTKNAIFSTIIEPKNPSTAPRGNSEWSDSTTRICTRSTSSPT
mmetsp:Transcript_16909/g.27309  ORF Transcript_16909/g.27309 Transcript_16909/m.27309 type:complete len:135 (-) Transcript_16909:1080-1484(-)